MARYGIIIVYRDNASGSYIIQPMSRHPTGAVADFGEPTVVSEGDFESEIADAVLQNLDTFDRKPFKREEAPRFSNEEYERFTRTHDRVTVTRQESGALEVSPATRVRVGYEGIKEALITLREDEVQTRLVAAIREAFTRTL